MKIRVQVLRARLDREPLEAFLAVQSLVWGMLFLTVPVGGLRSPFIWAYCCLYIGQGAASFWALSRWQYSLRRASALMGCCLWAFSAVAVLTMARGQLLAPYYALMAATCAWSFIRMGVRHAAA